MYEGADTETKAKRHGHGVMLAGRERAAAPVTQKRLDAMAGEHSLMTLHCRLNSCALWDSRNPRLTEL